MCLIPWGILRKFDDMIDVNITYWERIKKKDQNQLCQWIKFRYNSLNAAIKILLHFV